MSETDVVENAEPTTETTTPAVEPTPTSSEPITPVAAKSIAAGGEPTQQQEPDKPYWPDDWREKMAQHAAAGDDKKYQQRLQQLQRYVDPMAVGAKAFELEAKLGAGGLTKIPGKDATEEELKEFHKALGVPEDPKAYVENLALPDGVQLGNHDKELAGDFAASMHSAGLTQAQMNTAMSWYFKNEEARAAHIDTLDDQNRRSAEQALKEEWGASFKRNTNAIPSLFTNAAGGQDMNNENSLFNRLLGGRMADGTIIGDDPDMTRWLVSMAKEINPVSTVIDDAAGSGKGIDDEIAEIESLMRTDRRAYDKDPRKQSRYLELLEARSKHRARVA